MIDTVPRETKREYADEAFEWLQVHLEAGFTREEVLALMVADRSRSTLTLPSLSPDVEEVYSKLAVLLDRNLHDE